MHLLDNIEFIIKFCKSKSISEKTEKDVDFIEKRIYTLFHKNRNTSEKTEKNFYKKTSSANAPKV